MNNKNVQIPKKETNVNTPNWNYEIPIEIFFREILLSFSEDTIKEAITSAAELKARNVKELSYFQLQELEDKFGIAVGRRIGEVLQPSKILVPKKRFADANFGTAEVKAAVKMKKLTTDWDINDNRKFYQFTLSLAHHYRELKACWDTDYKKPDTENFLTDTEYRYLDVITKTFLPLRQKMKEITNSTQEIIDHTVYNLMQDAWGDLAKLQLPASHPLYTPLGFLFTKERCQVIRHFATVCSIRERGYPGMNRMLCKVLIGLKSTGKSTLLMTLCTLVALLFDKIVPVYVDYSLGCSIVHQLFVLACELRGQDSIEVIPLACGDEFQDLWKPNYQVRTIEVQVAKEFVAYPASGQIGVVAGSSHLLEYLFSTQIRPQFSNYPAQWNSDKYQQIFLYPLRTKDLLRQFLEVVKKLPNCKIADNCFYRITGHSCSDLSRDTIFDDLVQDANLAVIFEETAGVPGGILSFLSGGTPPCPLLPEMGSVERTILLELYQVNALKGSAYDPWNPVRISLERIRELAGSNVEREYLMGELKDK